MKLELDQFDLAILRHLQADANKPAVAIGAATGLSASAVQRRIKQLRQQQVILQDVIRLNPQALGLSLCLIVEVSFKQGLAATIDQFKQQMLAHAAIAQCYYLAGDFDFLLILHVADMASYEAFSREIFFPNPAIEKFRTTVVMDIVKQASGLAI